MSPWRNRLARSAVTSTLATERLVVQAHPGTKVLRSFFSVQIATEPELLYDVAVHTKRYVTTYILFYLLSGSCVSENKKSRYLEAISRYFIHKN